MSQSNSFVEQYLGKTDPEIIEKVGRILPSTMLVGAVYFVGKMIMGALNETGHDYATTGQRKAVKAIHSQKIAFAVFIIIILIGVFLYIAKK